MFIILSRNLIAGPHRNLISSDLSTISPGFDSVLMEQLTMSARTHLYSAFSRVGLHSDSKQTFWDSTFRSFDPHSGQGQANITSFSRSSRNMPSLTITEFHYFLRAILGLDVKWIPLKMHRLACCSNRDHTPWCFLVRRCWGRGELKEFERG